MARTHSPEPAATPSPEDGAAYWFSREATAPLTRQETIERDEWLAHSDANREAYDRARTLWGQLDTLAAQAEEVRTLSTQVAADATKPMKRGMDELHKRR